MTEEITPKPAIEKPEKTDPTPAAAPPQNPAPKIVAEEPKKTTKKPIEKKQDVIFIGNKPPMNYVLAIITALASGATTEITLKARGRAITTAVDVAEIAINRFIKDLKVKSIGIGTEEMPAREGENRSRMVSTMEIKLTKK